MSADFNPKRYDVITIKNPREIVMLRGSGCKWRRCTFCDYHLDFSRDEDANFQLNSSVLSQVTGLYHDLEVINSGSFNELDPQTIDAVEQICINNDIHNLHFEMHWMHRHSIEALRSRFASHGIRVHVKMGVETFDPVFRDDVLKKGMDHVSPEEIVGYADDATASGMAILLAQMYITEDIKAQARGKIKDLFGMKALAKLESDGERG